MPQRTRVSSMIVIALSLVLTGVALLGCDGNEGPSEPDAAVAMTPFTITARVNGATVDEVTAAIATYIHDVDDTSRDLPADWIVAGGDHLEEGESADGAALRLPGGSRIVEVCNHHYASMAMAFGGHHGVALPCEIAITQQGDDVEVVLLNPEAIFGVFFGDVPAEQAEQMGGMAATVMAELEDLVEASLDGFSADYVGEPVGPEWSEEELSQFRTSDYSVEMDVEIPTELRGSDEDRLAFKARFVEQLLTTLTHEEMEQIGSQVSGLSTEDWRAARPYALGLPGQVSVVEVCSPTYATAALSTGDYHAPALPCQIAIWVDGDMLRVHVLSPLFIFPVFFGDAPDEMMESMGGLATAVQQDLQLVVAAALDSSLQG